jgi:2-C-methyl-D-erythritol 4-phosphate cytidylyltransferase
MKAVWFYSTIDRKNLWLMPNAPGVSGKDIKTALKSLSTKEFLSPTCQAAERLSIPVKICGGKREEFQNHLPEDFAACRFDRTYGRDEI